MARAGLGPGWSCLLANDISSDKAAAYADNWKDDCLVVGDVRNLQAAQMEGRPDLAWASSPCQDLSHAGMRGGLDGGRSGALWPALDLVRQWTSQGRGPRIVVVENVVGMATSRRGDDLMAVVRALSDVGYRVGALVVDAKAFLPQSRARLFVVAAADDVPVHGLVSDAPIRTWHPASVIAAAGRCPGWVWWSPAPPEPRRIHLADLLEADGAVRWQTAATTGALLRLMTDRDRHRLEDARARGTVVGTLTRRMRPDGDGGRQQRAELRIDGVAGCLRTPGGGSSQQTLVVADEARIRTRAMTPRETARLMGLPDAYRLPGGRDDALRLAGEGVAVPVVRHLAATLLEPLLTADDPAAEPNRERRGIKGATRSTTLYLLPHELQRLRHLAVDLDVSLHDLMLRGLDRVLAENGQRPLERYR